MLADCWTQLAALHGRGIAHGRADLARFELDAIGSVQLRGFRAAQLGADDRRLGIDVAELLGAQAARVGTERAIDAAVAAMPADVLQASLPMLQPLAVSKATRAAVKKAQGKTFWTDRAHGTGRADRRARVRADEAPAHQRRPDHHRRLRRLPDPGPPRPGGQLVGDRRVVRGGQLGLPAVDHRPRAVHLRDRRMVTDGVCPDPAPHRRDDPGDVRAGLPQPVHPGQRRGDGPADPLPPAPRHRPHPERREHRAHQRRQRGDAGAAARGLRAVGRVDRRARLQPPRHGGDRLDRRRRARARRCGVPLPVGPPVLRQALREPAQARPASCSSWPAAR